MFTKANKAIFYYKDILLLVDEKPEAIADTKILCAAYSEQWESLETPDN